MSLRTGEVAKLARANVKTLRFSERQGILSEPPRQRETQFLRALHELDQIHSSGRVLTIAGSVRSVQDLLGLRTRRGGPPGKFPDWSKAKSTRSITRSATWKRGALQDLPCVRSRIDSPADDPLAITLQLVHPSNRPFRQPESLVILCDPCADDDFTRRNQAAEGIVKSLLVNLGSPDIPSLGGGLTDRLTSWQPTCPNRAPPAHGIGRMDQLQ